MKAIMVALFWIRMVIISKLLICDEYTVITNSSIYFWAFIYVHRYDSLEPFFNSVREVEYSPNCLKKLKHLCNVKLFRYILIYMFIIHTFVPNVPTTVLVGIRLHRRTRARLAYHQLSINMLYHPQC